MIHCCCSTTAGGNPTEAGQPDCICISIPTTLTMTSCSTTCAYGTFQPCTLQYGPTPSAYASLSLGSNLFLSTAFFHDTLEESLNPSFGPILFQYWFFCFSHTLFGLSRLYPSYPFHTGPYQDSIIYSWGIGTSGNTCSSSGISLSTSNAAGGVPIGAADCCVTVYGGSVIPPSPCVNVGIVC